MIIVLGARVSSDGQPSAALRRRLKLGVALFRAGVAPLLLLSGGGHGGVAEADVMRDIALEEAVPPSALLIEPRSRNTVENALECALLLKREGLGSVVLVTDQGHAIRAALLFRMSGITVQRVAAATIPARQLLVVIAGEVLKLPISVARMLFRLSAG